MIPFLTFYGIGEKSILPLSKMQASSGYNNAALYLK